MRDEGRCRARVASRVFARLLNEQDADHFPQTAEMLETSERTVQRLIKQQKLRAYYLGRLVRIADADIAALLDATRTF